MEALLLSSHLTVVVLTSSKLPIWKWTAVLPNVCISQLAPYHCTPTQLMSSPQSVVTCNISTHAPCLHVQLDAHFIIAILPCTCVCPYSTVASSVVAMNVPSEEGSSKGPDSSIRQAPKARGKCVCVCVCVCVRVCARAVCVCVCFNLNLLCLSLCAGEREDVQSMSEVALIDRDPVLSQPVHCEWICVLVLRSKDYVSSATFCLPCSLSEICCAFQEVCQQTSCWQRQGHLGVP